MSNKPTPAQARALRSLAADYKREWSQPYLNLWFTKEGKLRSVRNQNIKNKIRISTAQILLDNSWIEKVVDTYGSSRHVISYTGSAILATLVEINFVSPKTVNGTKSIWTTADIRDALIEKYRKLNDKGYENSAVWIFFCELGDHRFASRRVDFWAMACWRSLNYQKISYEIKISRADFLKEIRDPTKRQFALTISDQFYFVTPPNLVSLDELPDEAGLIELSVNGNLVTKRKAPNRITLFEFDWDFAATLGRSLFNAWQYEKLL